MSTYLKILTYFDFEVIIKVIKEALIWIKSLF